MSYESKSSSSGSDNEGVEGLPDSSQDTILNDLVFEETPFAKGAFGRIIKADYFGVTVCVKLIKKQQKKEFAKFVLREVAALKSLSHPNLVQFIGAAERADEICLVTEFISGGTLRKKLKRKEEEIPWTVRTQIVADIASAMAYLHSRKIMHRDLKSKNLLVSDNWKIKLCDFGFARSIRDKKGSHMTFCGTEEYMAPEVIFGMEYDELAEVYSFGLLVCEVIMRRKVEETTPRTNLTNYGLDQNAFKAVVPADCPPELLHLAFWCTQFKSVDRPDFREICTHIKEIKPHITNSQLKLNKQAVAPQHVQAAAQPPDVSAKATYKPVPSVPNTPAAKPPPPATATMRKPPPPAPTVVTSASPRSTPPASPTAASAGKNNIAPPVPVHDPAHPPAVPPKPSSSRGSDQGQKHVAPAKMPEPAPAATATTTTTTTTTTPSEPLKKDSPPVPPAKPANANGQKIYLPMPNTTAKELPSPPIKSRAPTIVNKPAAGTTATTTTTTTIVSPRAWAATVSPRNDNNRALSPPPPSVAAAARAVSPSRAPSPNRAMSPTPKPQPPPRVGRPTLPAVNAVLPKKYPQATA